MGKLTKHQRKLLVETAAKGFSQQHRSQARTVLSLADRGLVTWRWSDYRIDFALVEITDAGRAALAQQGE